MMNYKKISILIYMFIFFLININGQQTLFFIKWGNNKEDVGLKEIPITTLKSHKNIIYRVGPSSIGIDKKEHIYIFDRIRDKILEFNLDGKIINIYNVPKNTTLEGMAISDNGDIVVFSPIEKYILGIKGKYKDKKFYVPNYFRGISEVWFKNNEVWARYGWISARVDTRDYYDNTPKAIPISDKEIAIKIGDIENTRDNFKWTKLDLSKIEGINTIKNCYASGKFLNNRKILIVIEKDDCKELLIIDYNGNIYNRIKLSKCWAKSFSNFVIKDNKLYEMNISSKGILIKLWNLSLEREIKNIKAGLITPPKDVFYIKKVKRSRRSVNVWFRDKDIVKTMDLDDYLVGVVSQEIYASWTLEAHRCMAIVSRTYAVARYRHPSKNAHVCNTTCCQAWTPNPNPRSIRGVEDTIGIYVVKNGVRIREPLFFSHCNGHTRNSEDYNGWNYISYLRSKSCICGFHSYFGHGVGLCQYGMEAYARRGWSYKEIIEHYYTGCTVKKLDY